MILAIPGSLRRSSINAAALRAAALAAARCGIPVTIADAVRQLPQFDPDLEAAPPLVVQRFRADCEAADGVLLAVPEYTFGIPGAFKNALDWTVRSGSLYRKPIAVLHVAPAGRGAHVQHDRDADGEIIDTRIVEQLRTLVAQLAQRGSSRHAA